MNHIQADITTFMRAAGQDVPTHPTIKPLDVRVLQAKLIMEEAFEQVEALGVLPTIYDSEDGMHLTIAADVFEYKDGGSVDLVKLADGICDQVYVSVGTASAFGLNLRMPWHLVQEANMAKFGPGSYKRPDGKQMKPPGWMAPDEAIRSALLDQAHSGNSL